MRRVMVTVFFALMYVTLEPAKAAELKQETSIAFNRYIALTEDRMAKSLRDGQPFLWIDGFPETKRDALYANLRQGDIIIEQLETRDGERNIKVPHGLVHHWIALGFIPGVTLKQTLALLQDYEQYPIIYHPDVTRSRLLGTDGTNFSIYLRLYQKAIVTAVFDAEFDVSYFRVDESHVHSRSYSKRIAEVESPDHSDEREKPVGKDRGFLWRLYSYWRFQERDDGVYVQAESVGLSRSVPPLLAWFVNPLLKSIPRGYLSRLLNSTRTALTKSHPASSSYRGAARRSENNCPYPSITNSRLFCPILKPLADKCIIPAGESEKTGQPFAKGRAAHPSGPKSV